MPSAATITAAALAWLSVTCTALVPSLQPYSAVRTGFAGRHQTRLWRHEVRLRSEETPTEPAAEESAEEAAPTEPERPKQFGEWWHFYHPIASPLVTPSLFASFARHDHSPSSPFAIRHSPFAAPRLTAPPT